VGSEKSDEGSRKKIPAARAKQTPTTHQRRQAGLELASNGPRSFKSSEDGEALADNDAEKRVNQSRPQRQRIETEQTERRISPSSRFPEND